jgi:acyl carrier protein
MDIESRLRSYVVERLLFTDGNFDYDDSTSFLQSGLIDSMGVMELVAWVDSDFGIRVQPADITPENFDSVSRLAAYIRRKQVASPELVHA